MSESERVYGLQARAANDEAIQIRRVFASCSGPCSQGRKLCPSPAACQQAEPEPVTFWRELVSLFCFWR